MQTHNHDVAGHYRRCNKYCEELVKSASSGVNDVNEFDRKRFESYIASLGSYLTWVENQPQLDLPETHPQLIELPAPAEIPETIENLMVGDLLRLFVSARDELVNSQSSRNATGLLDFDMDRQRKILEKCSTFLSEYVDKVAPLDMPESSPQAPSTGAGRTGI